MPKRRKGLQNQNSYKADKTKQNSYKANKTKAKKQKLARI
jgi:hypothetical protein